MPIALYNSIVIGTVIVTVGSLLYYL